MEIPEAPGIEFRVQDCQLLMLVQQDGHQVELVLDKHTGELLRGKKEWLDTSLRAVQIQSYKTTPDKTAIQKVFELRGAIKGIRLMDVNVLARATAQNRIMLSLIVFRPESSAPERFQDGYQMEIPGYLLTKFKTLAEFLIGETET